ncbi:MAG TPA: metallopeptidase family protein [Kiritimatiellia bacterium]|nr:metallopeptidase family protein [Kiritimatiellia bacterium]
MPPAQHQFKRLLIAAEAEVQHTLAALPRPLREKARAVPVSYERKPSPEVQAEGIEEDTLGLFVGETFKDAYAGAHDLPAQVILYLDNLWDYANHDPEFFREEVHRTLLHELGHYLGLDEEDLAERELD